jgi:hypothetical protein
MLITVSGSADFGPRITWFADKESGMLSEADSKEKSV